MTEADIQAAAAIGARLRAMHDALTPIVADLQTIIAGLPPLSPPRLVPRPADDPSSWGGLILPPQPPEDQRARDVLFVLQRCLDTLASAQIKLADLRVGRGPAGPKDIH